jgi:predicted RNA-binding Zn-ribbon protein involved in translation (DUF1610 family)
MEVLDMKNELLLCYSCDKKLNVKEYNEDYVHIDCQYCGEYKVGEQLVSAITNNLHHIDKIDILNIIIKKINNDAFSIPKLSECDLKFSIALRQLLKNVNPNIFKFLESNNKKNSYLDDICIKENIDFSGTLWTKNISSFFHYTSVYSNEKRINQEVTILNLIENSISNRAIS